MKATFVPACARETPSSDAAKRRLRPSILMNLREVLIVRLKEINCCFFRASSRETGYWSKNHGAFAGPRVLNANEWTANCDMQAQNSQKERRGLGEK